ncbi:SLG1 [Fusarium acuminatum]|uniref:SLG1 n=1 Tax=Fusarium acuminatum TaxID=5515 RepID=A0ABZ2X9N5_9HYPO
MMLTRFAFLSLLASAGAVDHIQQPKKSPVLNQVTSQGCFDSLPNETISGQNSTFNTVGTCADYCQEKNTEVALLQGKSCFCSHSYPPEDSQVDDDQCDEPCPGYPRDACGGKDAFSVYNLGVNLLPGYDDGENKGETAATSTASALTKSAATSTTHNASADAEKASATKSEQGSVSTAAVEEPSKVANSASDSVVPATPSPTTSTVPNNGALRFSNPIGNAVHLMRQFLD